MPSPPETDREYAYFRAVGVFSPDEITQCLGIEPIECWEVGDKHERRGRTFKRRNSSWQIESGLLDTSPLNAHLDALLRKLEPLRNELLHIGTFAKLQTVCVGHYYQNFCWELDRAYVTRAASLGLGYWFDTYDYGDLHEEISEMREQLK